MSKSKGRRLAEWLRNLDSNSRASSNTLADDSVGSDQLAHDLALQGNPTAATQSSGNSSTRLATTAFVATEVAALVDSAPGALNTLNELAAAINDDASFSTTITNSIALKAPLASPALTGTPTAPTASSGTNTTQLATTAFVTAATSGLATDTNLANKAPINSPTFTGTPAAPTASAGTNTTQIATTAFVTTAVAGASTAGISSSADATAITIDSSENVGIGEASPTSKLHVRGTSGAGSRVHIRSEGAGLNSFDGSGSGLLLTANGMNTTSKFTPAIQFGTTDPSFTTTNPKVGAAINGVASQTYSQDDRGGMELAFYTTPNDPGTGQTITERMRIDNTGAVAIGGSTFIGSRAKSLSVVGDDNSSTIASKTTSYDTVFSVLPWSSATTYLGIGTYYDDGNWVHASDNATAALLALAGDGVHWYASSGSTVNHDVVTNAPLWNATGQWDGDINTAYDINTGNIVLTETGSGNGCTSRYINDHVTNGFYIGLRQNTTGDAFLYTGDNRDIEIWTNATFRGQFSRSGDLELTANGSQYIGGMGAATTGGTTDWNDATNARSGNGHTLLLGNHSNGPGLASYYHPFSFEYNNKDGTGNMTQFAIPYNDPDGQGMWFRSRYSGTWTDWHPVSIGVGTTTSTIASSGDIYVGVNAESYVRFQGSTGTKYARFYLESDEDFRLTEGGHGYFNGNVIAYSTAIASDAKLKDNVKPLQGCLDKVCQMRGVSYTWNEQSQKEGVEDIGVIAQEMAEIYPEVVTEVEGLNGRDPHLTVDYARLAAVLINAVKELRVEVEELKNGTPG